MEWQQEVEGEKEREGDDGAPKTKGGMDEGDGDDDEGEQGVQVDLFGATTPWDTETVAEGCHDGGSTAGWHACAWDHAAREREREMF